LTLLKNFYVGLLLIVIITCGTTFIVEQLTVYQLQTTYFAIGFYTLLTWVAFQLAMLGKDKSNKTFMRAFFSSLYLHLFLSIGFILIWLIFSKERNIPFIISYLILYILFTVFEVLSLLNNLRPISKNKPSVEE
jgi:hypothetical protein